MSNPSLAVTDERERNLNTLNHGDLYPILGSSPLHVHAHNLGRLTTKNWLMSVTVLRNAKEVFFKITS